MMWFVTAVVTAVVTQKDSPLVKLRGLILCLNSGAGDEDRTHDNLLGKQELYH